MELDVKSLKEKATEYGKKILYNTGLLIGKASKVIENGYKDGRTNNKCKEGNEL